MNKRKELLERMGRMSGDKWMSKRKTMPLRAAPGETVKGDVVRAPEQLRSEEESPQVEAAKRGDLKPNRRALEHAISLAKNLKRPADRFARGQPFQVPAFPPTIKIPATAKKLAMDEATSWAAAQWGNYTPGVGLALFNEGLGFLGYPFLAELSQRPEYRVIVETIATDMTRKWIKLKSKSEEENKDEKINELGDELERLKVREVFEQCEEIDGYFGRAHLYIDTGDTEEEKELVTPIGDGWSKLSKQKLKQGTLQRLVPIEPVWTYPTTYNSANPLRPDWYNPQLWYVQATQIHQSRLLRFVGREVPDLLKPAYSFGGLALTQMVKPYVMNWLNTRQAVADIVQAFSVFVVATNMQATLQEGGDDAILRADLFNYMRTNAGLFMIDKETEDFMNVSAPLGTLDALQAQSQEQMASISRIPLVKLLGTTPKGLNATAEPEMDVYNDSIHAAQEKRFRPNLRRVIGFAMLNIWGEIDDDIDFDFVHLKEATPKEKAEIQKIKTENDTALIDKGIIDPAESRSRIATDPDSDYNGLDPDDLPEPPEPEMGDGSDDGEGGGGGPGGPDNPPGGPAKPDKGAAMDSATPFVEGDHPRAPDGKFGSGGGSSTSKPIKASELRQVGKQQGSNEGGVFENVEGERFYVKKGQTKAHVTNEVTAANLYQLAGLPTLNYRPVEGGTHIATEMAKLEKNNVSKLTPAERKEAQKAFAVHAWLGNWDAAGTGGDNQGVIDGKVTTLDVGGALEYRAQGGPKGDAFGNKVLELDTMRDPDKSPDAARLFGKMTPEQIKESAKLVAQIPDADIVKTVKASGGKPALAQRLIRRKRDMSTLLGIAMDEFTESKHPRVKGGEHAGEFAPGGGASGASAASGEAPGGGGSANEVTLPAKAMYGGQYVQTGSSPEENHKLTVAKVLAQPTKIGINPLYRGMLEKLLADSKEHGTEAQVPAIKQKLHEAFMGFSKILMDQATAEPDEAKGKKIYDLSLKAAQKGAQYKVDGPVNVPISTPAPKVEKMSAGTSVINPPKPAPKPEPVKAAPPTAAELEKAKKPAALQMKYVPYATQMPIEGQQKIKKQVDAFNKKWEGKSDLSQGQLAEKVSDFKEIEASVAPMKAEIEKKQAEEQANFAEKQKAEAAKKAEAMKQTLGGAAGVESYKDLSGITGSGEAEDFIKSAKSKIDKSPALKAAGITPAQGAHIGAYSSSYYASINSGLRKGALTIEQYNHVKQLNSALEQLPPHAETTWRKTSIPKEEFANYKPGMVIEERGFMSTSKNKGTWHGDQHFEVRGKNGRDIQGLSHHSSEAEVLFRSGTRFQIISNDGHKVVMQEV